MEDLIKLYVQFVFQAKKIQVNVSQKISSGDKLKVYHRLIQSAFIDGLFCSRLNRVKLCLLLYSL